MSNSEIEKKALQVVKNRDILTVESVMNVNFNPHPYVITPTHISQVKGKYLNEDSVRQLEKNKGRGMCGHKGCTLTYDEHKRDKVVFLKLKRNCTKDEFREQLANLDEVVKDYIDGYTLIETEQKFKIN